MSEHGAAVLACSCGAVFRTASAEARHRHNFPSYCRKPRRGGVKPKGPGGLHTRRKSRAKPQPDHVPAPGKMVPA